MYRIVNHVSIRVTYRIAVIMYRYTPTGYVQYVTQSHTTHLQTRQSEVDCTQCNPVGFLSQLCTRILLYLRDHGWCRNLLQSHRFYHVAPHMCSCHMCLVQVRLCTRSISNLQMVVELHSSESLRLQDSPIEETQSGRAGRAGVCLQERIFPWIKQCLLLNIIQHVVWQNNVIQLVSSQLLF